MPDRTYRCLNCLEHTLTRPFDVSHLSITCPVCEEFQRFVNDDVLDQYEAFEDDPPDSLEWDRLERAEKLMVSDQVVRTGRSVEDFSLDRSEPPSETDDDGDATPDAEDGSDSDATDGSADDAAPDSAE
jgi:phage FluMu protein Com